MNKRIFLVLIFSALFSLSFMAQVKKFDQPVTLDKVVAVIDKHMIMKSEIEDNLQAGRARGMYLGENGDCEILEELLYRKLLLAHAERDSVSVTDSEVENELNRRMNYYITEVFKSEEKMEEVYQKTIDEIKNDMRPDVRDQKIEEKMQQKIAGDVKVSPAEIRAYFKTIPEDSLPLINSEVEIAQIVAKPAISEKAKELAREKIAKLRKSIVNDGESFAALAILYSEDPGSASRGGLYENVPRGQFMPEFEAAALRLKPGEVSEIVETTYGFHIITLVARRGELYDCRHILISAKMSNEDMTKARIKLDTVYERLKSGKITFCEAATKYSDEKETKQNCGLVMNMSQGSTRFEVEELGQMDDKIIFMLDQLKEGEYSKPVMFATRDGKQAYRIIMLKKRIAPHKINLKDDYQKLQVMAQNDKQQKTMNEWISRKIKSTYISLDPYYARCKFNNEWLKQNAGNQ